MTLPTNSPSKYVTPVRTHGDLAFVSGQLPRIDGELAYRGLVGAELTLDQARHAAALCAQASLAALRHELPANREIAEVIKLTGYVASTPAFHQQPAVIDAASEVLLEAFGPAGKHARSAIGVAALPHGASVEVEIIVVLRAATP